MSASWITENDFFTLADISPVRTWNYRLPTLAKDSRFTSRQSWTESASFWERFLELVPAFEAVNLDGVAIVGGAVVDLILQSTPKDIDLFLVLDNDVPNKGALLAERVDLFIKDMISYMKKEVAKEKERKERGKATGVSFDLHSINVVRYKNIYTIRCDALPYPVQFTHCGPLKERFANTDLSCTEIAYYRGEVVMSKAGKFCLESLVFPVKPEMRSTKYVERLIKYFDKGFDIILPNLAMDKVPRKNIGYGIADIIDLPEIIIVFNDIKDSKIIVSHINKSDMKYLATTTSMARYDANPDEGLNSGTIIHRNIKSLISGDTDDFLYEGKGELYRQALSPNLPLTERMIMNSYETVRTNLFERDDGTLKLGTLEDFYTVKEPRQILEESVIKYLQEAEKDENREKYFGVEFKKFMDKYLEKLTEEQIVATVRLATQNAGKGSLEYPEEPVDEAEKPTLADWYGQFLDGTAGATDWEKVYSAPETSALADSDRMDVPGDYSRPSRRGRGRGRGGR